MGMTLVQARQAGYTKYVHADNIEHELDLLIHPETLDNLDGSFKAYCMDENEIIRVNGWCFNIQTKPN